ncbi:MAG: 4'-phosphopantetheinyl transferase superfamily protein [Firmicutes bacterium]|nr:4'-phosphopantetheinyl transferase superfamily protein [Bacillota bacterium]
MLIVKWAPIAETTWDPSFDPVLAEHIGAYRNPKVRRASLSAWELLYRMLEENGLRGQNNPPLLQVAFEENGKPYFVENPVYFSISHSHGVCAAAVADRPVGVDVERIRDSYNPRLVERSLTDAEKKAYEGDFTRIWSRKEAVGKMTGKGITGYPNGIETGAYSFREERIEADGEAYWVVACCEGQFSCDEGQNSFGEGQFSCGEERNSCDAKTLNSQEG